MKNDELNELADFLTAETRLDVKSLALHHVLSLTGTVEGREMLILNGKIVDNIINLAFSEREQKQVTKDAFFTLINLSSNETDSLQILHKNPNLIKKLLDYVLNAESKFADVACGVLSNLSRGNTQSEMMFDIMQNDSANNFERLLTAFCIEDYNKLNKLDYLAPFICNLTQIKRVREYIMNKPILFKRLLPFTSYLRSSVRRGGIVGSIKNCCFDYDNHDALLDSDIDLLSRLLLPLAGPEEFDDDINDKLPDDLQYLPPEKERESDPDIRIMLVETVMLLCSKKKCREYIIDKNTYFIMRELYNWEKDELVKEACEKLINVLISDEPEQGMENLHEVLVPESLTKKFYSYDQASLEKKFDE